MAATRKMAKGRRKLIYALARIVLCAVFISLAVRGVVVHDRVTVVVDSSGGAEELRLRLVGETPSAVTVVGQGGEEETLPRHRVAVDDKGEERIERGLATAWSSSDFGILMAAFAAFAPVVLIQSLRFQFMLRAQEIRLAYWECVKLSFGGNFLNFVFLIGSTAGDIFKAYYTSRHTVRKTEAVTTVLLDRIVGLSGLLVVAAVMSLAGSDSPMLRRMRFMALLLLSAFLVGGWMLISRRVTSLAPRRLLARLPGGDHIKRIHEATERLIRHLPLLLGCLVLAVVLQFIAVGAGVLCAYALHMEFSGSKVWDYFAYIGGGHMVAAIPISVLGLGTMEFAYKQFFLDTYGSLAQLLCLALWVRLLQLFWALPGAFITLLGGYRPPPLAAETNGQVGD